MEQISVARPRAEVLVNEFVRSVYNWMAIGLGLTGCMALYVSNSPAITRARDPRRGGTPPRW